MADIDVIIPFGGDDIYRGLNLRFVAKQWETHTNLLTSLGRHEGPWCKASAVSEALETHHLDADWLIITDGDVWCENFPTWIDDVMCSEQQWGIPHKTIDRLDATSTSKVLNGGPWGGTYAKPPYKSVAGGGTVMLRREMYEQVPLDPRFVGWGYEDECWGLGLMTMFGEPLKGTDPMWHLWHPPAVPKTGRVMNTDKRRLRQRYHSSAYRTKLMSQLLAEV
jgi:hypothetical protein